MASRVRQYWYRFAVFSVILIALASLVFLLWTYTDYRATHRLAFQSFTESRGDLNLSIDSYEFISHGVKYGFTEKQVEAIFGRATELSGRVQMKRPEFHNYGFERHFYIVYQPEYRGPYDGQAIPIVTERFFVFFDHSGRTFALERWLFLRGDVNRTGATWLNLRDKQITKGIAAPE